MQDKIYKTKNYNETSKEYRKEFYKEYYKKNKEEILKKYIEDKEERKIYYQKNKEEIKLKNNKLYHDKMKKLDETTKILEEKLKLIDRLNNIINGTSEVMFNILPDEKKQILYNALNDLKNQVWKYKLIKFYYSNIIIKFILFKGSQVLYHIFFFYLIQTF